MNDIIDVLRLTVTEAEAGDGRPATIRPMAKRPNDTGSLRRLHRGRAVAPEPAWGNENKGRAKRLAEQLSSENMRLNQPTALNPSPVKVQECGHIEECFVYSSFRGMMQACLCFSTLACR